MDISTWNDEELVEELIEILEYMVRQYLPEIDGKIINHDRTIAGEKSLALLEALGRVETPDMPLQL